MIKRMRLPIPLFIAGIITLGFGTLPVAAASAQVSVGTNGTDCSAGGYVTPSSLPVNSGDTVTFSVPASDPDQAGIQITGFPQGTFTVAAGDSVTTDPVSADVSYSSTSVTGGCAIGGGTVTVTAPVQPAPTGSVTPATPTGSSTSAPSPAATPATSTTTAATPKTDPTATTTTTTPTITPSAPSASDTQTLSMSPAIYSQPRKSTAFNPLPLILMIIGVAVLAAGSVLGFLWLRRRRIGAPARIMHKPIVVPPAVEPLPVVVTPALAAPVQPEPVRPDPVAVPLPRPTVPKTRAFINPYKILVQ